MYTKAAPPHPAATMLPEGAYAHAITQVLGIVMVVSLLAVKPSHTITFPSCAQFKY